MVKPAGARSLSTRLMGAALARSPGFGKIGRIRPANQRR
jgi:hypothetical protein